LHLFLLSNPYLHGNENQTIHRIWPLYFRISLSGPVTRSLLLSVFLSLEIPQIYIDEAVQDGLTKETRALVDTFQEGVQQVSTKYLAGISDSRTYPGWAKSIGSHIIDFFAKSIRNRSAIFPVVNRIKNVGVETAYAYSFRDPSKGISDVTTYDLQHHEWATGEQISGPCEVRMHFKFNDIKPRVYFAQGGTSYFKSRYMKQIAIQMMESISASRERNRSDPVYFLNTNSSFDDNVLLNWDLTAFTSTLQELRFFIHQFTTILERKYGPLNIKLFSWRDGIVKQSLVAMLYDYNESMNYHPEFSLVRMADDLSFEEGVLISRNGGLLGVPGNIGMSTFLHGIIAERACGDGNAICVGDDAAAIGTTQTLEILRQDIARIGKIHLEKFEETRPTNDTKFLKRRVTFGPNGLTIDELIFSMPTAYDTLGVEPKGRTVTKKSWYDRCKRMCQIFGHELWRFLRFSMEITDKDIQEFSQIMKSYYAVFNLSRRGGFPGLVIHHGGEKTMTRFVVPPIPFREFDPRVTDWAEWMLTNREVRFTSIPRMVKDTIKLHELDLIKGTESICTQSEFVRYLEDIGAAEVIQMTEVLDFEMALNRRRFLGWLKRVRGKKVLSIRMLRTLPNSVNVEGLVTTDFVDTSKLSVDTLE
jgi:hypothetical protein